MNQYKVEIKPPEEDTYTAYIFVYADSWSSACAIAEAMFDNTGMEVCPNEV